MAANTKISWAHHTHNHWEGCTKVGPGCDHCYAEARNARFGGGRAPNWGPGAPRRLTSEANRGKPLLWNREARKLGIRYRVFCSSLADVWDNEVPIRWLAEMLGIIRQTQHLDWLLVTKRIGNVQKRLIEVREFAMVYATVVQEVTPFLEWIEKWLDGAPPPNVWLGATIVNQAEADRDIPKLLATPAVLRFLSMEPLLGPVDLTRHLHPKLHFQELRGEHTMHDVPRLDWIIVGGESGGGARAFDVAWARSIVSQCRAATVPVHVKQLGAHVITNGISEPGQHWPRSTGEHDTGLGHFRKHLVDRKGGDLSEWPEDLRVQEVPASPADGRVHA